MASMTKRKKCILGLIEFMGAYSDYVELHGKISKSIDKKCGCEKTISSTNGESVFCDDIITAYNGSNVINYGGTLYGSVFRSSKPRKRNSYHGRFLDDFIKAIHLYYSTGLNLGGMTLCAAIDGAKRFYELVKVA